MKKILALLALIVNCQLSMLNSQTLNVVVGNVTYQFPAAQAGQMNYADGTTLTIMGKEFTLSDISRMYIDNSTVTDNLVTVDYSSSSASVKVAGNVAQYVSPTLSGAHVTIAQSNTEAVDEDEITYALSGSSTDGGFALSGQYKCTVSLAGLQLTNPSGAAIYITNGKRIQISAKKNTENTLADGAGGSHNGCIYSKGQIQLQGNGILNVAGNTSHAIKSGDYISVKNLTLNITSAVKDGISCNQYFLMKSGTVTISGVGDDGIQADLDGDEVVAAADDDHTDEDTGNIYLEGGTLTVTSTATAAKCIKSFGTTTVSGGTITVNAHGDIDLSATDEKGNIDPSYTAGIKTDGDFVQTGGEIIANVYGSAGRGIAADGTLTVDDGTLTVKSTAATKSSNTSSALYFCTAKGLKATNVAINGGIINVTSSGAASKGIKADDGSITITGGTITATMTGAGAIDYTESDGKGCAALNADQDITIKGGTLTLKATGTGGKGIKADGTLTIADQANVNATATGSNYSSGSYSASAKAVKAGTKTLKSSRTANSHTKRNPAYDFTGGIVITGGTLTATASSHEAIESKSTITISGGNVYAQSKDDAINSASTFTISGGQVCAYSTGNDGMDANGDFLIKGGNIYTISASSPEVGIDANTEQGFSLTLSGGNVAAIGGLESGSTLSQTCYQLSGSNTGGSGRPGQGGFGPGGMGGSQSWTANTWYALYSGSTLAFAFKTPSSGGSALVVSTAGTAKLNVSSTSSPISTSNTIWQGMGATTASGGTSATLSTYSGGNGR